MLIFTFKIVLFTNLVLFMANSFNKLHASFFHFDVNIKIILVMKTHMGVNSVIKMDTNLFNFYSRFSFST